MLPPFRLMATAALLMHAVPSLHKGIDEDDLPMAVRLALDKVHQPPARGGGGSKEFSRYEDVTILLQHFRDRVPLAQIRLVRRGDTAAKRRWQTLKVEMKPCLHELQRLRHTGAMDVDVQKDSPEPESAMLQLLQRQELDLPNAVQHALVQLHAAKEASSHDGRRLWSLDQDGYIVAEYLSGTAVSVISVNGRGRGAVKRRLSRLKQQLSLSCAAFKYALSREWLCSVSDVTAA